MEIVHVPEAHELAPEDQKFCEATKAWFKRCSPMRRGLKGLVECKAGPRSYERYTVEAPFAASGRRPRRRLGDPKKM